MKASSRIKNDYCKCDVLDTYFVMLRVAVLTGRLTLAREQELVDKTRKWLEDQAQTTTAFQIYLEQWGDWTNPW